ncbi:uncharacterized protein LOC143005323 isoform X2 [Genypterus blacodes]|uniref:uncharacterized protein LOC143005323 isoform X2 n=1 Tax=Genypterus blacodes TaxID=154954 RepID=UPI003F764443
MANQDEGEPMDCSGNDDTQQPATTANDPTAEQTEAQMSVAGPTDEAHFGVCVKWPGDKPPQKCKTHLQLSLQFWSNKNCQQTDCNVLHVSPDGGKAIVKINPASARREFQKLSGPIINKKDQSQVTIVSVHPLSQPLTCMLDWESACASACAAPMDELTPLPSPAQDEAELMKPQGAANATVEEGDFVYVPVSPLWYVTQVYREELSRIEEVHGVKYNAQVKVSFEVNQKDGDKKKALSEFTDLVQKCCGESSVFSVPLKDAHPEDWKEPLQMIQKKENKLFLSMSSEEIIVRGPSKSQEALLRSLNVTTNANKSVCQSGWGSDAASPVVVMVTKDPLVDAGLTMDEGHWKMMTTSPSPKIAAIKSKFGVDFKESHVSQGKINVKVCSTNAESPSMLSHALRSLLRLYQRAVTSPRNIRLGANGGSGEVNGGAGNSLRHGFEAEGKYVTMGNRQTSYPQVPMEGGATGGNSMGENSEETCSICIDTFTNKVKLACNHEFCAECLKQAKNASGPICPLCKFVFGKMEGNQPDGRMQVLTSVLHLDGFPNCGSIIITYDIYDGKQTEKHPHPGKSFHGFRRTAYLPNNKEGNEVLQLLKKAFDQRLIFTIGTSRTSGLDDQVTWNDIHHKTSTTGGPNSFGYPDPNYLMRVKEELKAKGIM